MGVSVLLRLFISSNEICNCLRNTKADRFLHNLHIQNMKVSQNVRKYFFGYVCSAKTQISQCGCFSVFAAQMSEGTFYACYSLSVMCRAR